MEKSKKINFFKRLKIAIFNLDEYGVFIEEKVKVAIKYMFIIVIFTSMVLAFVTTNEYSKELDKGLSYFKNEFPDFYFEDLNLKLDGVVYGYDKTYDVKIVADATDDLEKSELDEYIKQTKDVSVAIILLNNKFIYRSFDVQNEYSYEYVNTVFPIKDSTKTQILEQYDKLGGNHGIIITGGFITFVFLVLENILELFTYVLLVAAIGMIVGRICQISIKYSVAITLAIYSLTVSVICKFAYGIAYNLTGFEIKYFEAMYLMIAYVYIIAAILILKADLNKQAKELMRIKSVQEEVKDEIKKKELEEKELKDKKEKEEKKEPKGSKEKTGKEEPNMEPDGSEV